MCRLHNVLALLVAITTVLALVAADDEQSENEQQRAPLHDVGKRHAPLFEAESVLQEERDSPYVDDDQDSLRLQAKRRTPMYFGKRRAPMFFGKRAAAHATDAEFEEISDLEDESLEADKRRAPMFFGKRRAPMFFGKRRAPMFFGKRDRTPMFFGKRERPPMFFGKRERPPMFFGKRERAPMFFGKRQNTPMFFGKRQKTPMFFGKRQKTPMFFGKRLTDDLADSPDFPPNADELPPNQVFHDIDQSSDTDLDKNDDMTDFLDRIDRDFENTYPLSNSNPPDGANVQGSSKRSISSQEQLRDELREFVIANMRAQIQNKKRKGEGLTIGKRPFAGSYGPGLLEDDDLLQKVRNERQNLERLRNELRQAAIENMREQIQNNKRRHGPGSVGKRSTGSFHSRMLMRMREDALRRGKELEKQRH